MGERETGVGGSWEPAGARGGEGEAAHAAHHNPKPLTPQPQVLDPATVRPLGIVRDSLRTAERAEPGPATMTWADTGRDG